LTGESETIPKYMMYSAHDNQIANLWVHLQPVNFSYDYIPYSSYITMQLYMDQDCIKNNQLEIEEKADCFIINLISNG